MWKLQHRRWSERPRILMLMLGMMLPAAALIVFSAFYLRNMQREKVIEAAYQVDYEHTLAIAEKQINERAYDMADNARMQFPDMDSSDADGLDSFLTAHPDIAHAILWTGKDHFIFRSQPSRMSSGAFCAEDQALASHYADWWNTDGKTYINKLRWHEANEGTHFFFMNHWVTMGDKMQYQSLVLFLPRGSSPERPALAGMIYDTDYLKNKFFPAALNEVMPDQNQGDSMHPRTAIMVRTDKEDVPLAASASWDGGKAEVERPFQDVFSDLILGIKLRGTTIADVSARFLRTHFLILAALSLLMGAGMFFTYRSVARELALAKLKSDFVSNVSHELRTPLALIRLYAETLELGRISGTGKQQEYYEIIRKESERLSSLINNILDFSRIESGKKEYLFRETNVADLVRDTLESYRFEIEQNGFKFEQKIASDVPPLLVDREAIARSLLNLVNNALKYSLNEKYLGVNLYRDNNGAVNLEVIDHGIGIPPKEQSKIFEKFYRVGDPLVHNTKGSGLGLSLVCHIVQAHGGEVAVESAPGQGSKFTITLPMKNSTFQQANEAPA
ncbi:MAG TPA: HAMP domain-containing sensor histidine kinase [Silvibacterium sp.]|nr:HAMP domain-containing sensor histidine kinase [Silvibacterium sp.]